VPPPPTPFSPHCWLQLAAGLLHCHSVGVWHLDVKPDNVLVAHSGAVKLTDFGSASTTRHTRRAYGTLQYACPESLARCTCVDDGWEGDHGGGGAAPTRVLGVAVESCAALPTQADAQADAHTNAGGTGARAAWLASPRGGEPGPVEASVSASASASAASRLSTPSLPALVPVSAGRRPCIDAGKADVWALGVSLAACLLGLFPFAAARLTDLTYATWADAYARVRASQAQSGSAPPQLPQTAHPGPCPYRADGCAVCPADGACCSRSDGMDCSSRRCSGGSEGDCTAAGPPPTRARWSCECSTTAAAPVCSAGEGLPSPPLSLASTAALGRLLAAGCVVEERVLGTQGGRGGSAAPGAAGALDLIVRMLDPDPATRLTMDAVVQHPWLAV
jgi:serine/threonine protein kinase